MLQEGLTQEGLTLVRGIHDRYDGVKRNPWNEIECGDHYARAMAAWGCLLGVSGYVYDGPAGTIGFAPRMTPDDFKCFFTAAEGWGSLVQRREARQADQSHRSQMGYTPRAHHRLGIAAGQEAGHGRRHGRRPDAAAEGQIGRRPTGRLIGK